MTTRRIILVLGAVMVAALAAAALVILPSSDERASDGQRTLDGAARPFVTGVQAGRLDNDVRVSAALGARVARVEWNIATPAVELVATVTDYARRGIRVQPLAGFEGRVPTADEAKNVGAWARTVGPKGAMWRAADPNLAVQAIEFGSETSYAYQGTQRRGGDYARRAREASITTNAAGVGLYIQADEANQVDRWIDQMYDAVPDLHRYAAAWVLHPYGPQWRRMIDLTIFRTEQRGAPKIPIAVTEYGIANDDGRCLDDNYGWPRCPTSVQAAELLEQVVREMRAEYPRIRQFLLYNNQDLRPPGTDDNRENYFGARRSDGSSKGAYTRAAEALMTSDGPSG